MEKSFSLSEISNVLPITPSNSLEEVALDTKLSYPLLLEAILERQDDVVEVHLLKNDEALVIKVNSRLGLTWSSSKRDDVSSEETTNGFPTEEYLLDLSKIGNGYDIPLLSVTAVDSGDEDISTVLTEVDDKVKELLDCLQIMPEMTAFIAKYDGNPVGVAMFAFGPTEALCYCLYVKQSMRGKGIGKSLIYEAGKYAKERGLLEMHAFSAPLGIPVFQNIGFQKIATWKAYFSNQKINNLIGFLFGTRPTFDSRGYVELELALMKKYEGMKGFTTLRKGSVAAFKYPFVVRQTYGIKTLVELNEVKEFMGDEEFKLFYEPGLVPESLENEPSLLIREMRLQICDFNFSAKVECENVVLKIAKDSEDFELISDVFLSVYNIPKNCSTGHCESAIYATKLLAIIDGAAAACAFLEPVDTLCKVSYLQVSPNFRRRNVATAIMSFAVQVAQSLGCTELFLRSMPDAEPLYRKLGFSYVKDWYRIILNSKY